MSKWLNVWVPVFKLTANRVLKSVARRMLQCDWLIFVIFADSESVGCNFQNGGNLQKARFENYFENYEFAI